jgi:hypothetical protein
MEDRTALSPLLFAGDRRGRLFTIDVATGAVAIRGTMARPMFDIAFDPGGTLYAVDARSTLYRVDPGNAATTRVGPVGAAINALVFAPDGTLYGAGRALYRIDPATGAGTRIGRFRGLRSAGDLAFDGTGNLYMSTATNRLARVDPLSGSAAVIGRIGFRDIFGLGFGPDGVMYGVSDRTEQLIAIDLQTGRGTAIARFGGQGTSGVDGSSFVEEAVTPRLAIGDATAREGDPGTTGAVFTVSLSTAIGRPVTVQYATVAGTATAGVDYIATAGTLQFGPGQTTGTITVPVLDDRRRDGDEAFTVVLSAPSNATIARGTGNGTIVENVPPESAGSLQLGAAAYDVDEGAGRILVTVTRVGGAAGPASVRLTTGDGTAKAGTDYGATSVIVNFGAEDAQPKVVAIAILNDTTFDGDETFMVTLSDVSGGAVLGVPSTATATIHDAYRPTYTGLIAPASRLPVAGGQASTTAVPDAPTNRPNHRNAQVRRPGLPIRPGRRSWPVDGRTLSPNGRPEISRGSG